MPAWCHTRRRFFISLYVRVYDSGWPVKCARNIAWKIHVTNCNDACYPAPHAIMYFYILLWFYIRINFSRQTITYTGKYCQRQNCHIIHCYTHACFKHHHPLLNMIQKHISLIQIIFLLVKSETSWFKHNSELDNLPLGWIRDKSIQTQIWFRSFPSWSNQKQVN